MPDPDRLPVRVLVKGASTVVYTSYMGGPRTDFAWPRELEAGLRMAGWDADVRCNAVPAQLTKYALRTWEHEVLTWSPDVIVLQYGHMECVHRFLPRVLERHANSLRAQPTPIRQLYRNRLLKPLWVNLCKVQAVVDGMLSSDGVRRRHRRVVKRHETLLRHYRSVQQPLVVLCEIPPPGKPYQKWFPGMGPRIAVMNQQLRELVERLGDPNVRYFSLVDTVLPLVDSVDDICPDGGHLSPPLHAAVGQALARLVAEWADEQPHLRHSQRDEHRRAHPWQPVIPGREAEQPPTGA